MQLTPDEAQLTGETQLTGAWQEVGGGAEGDRTWARIEALVATVLQRLGCAQGGWSTLYRDPADGRLWERTYPQSQLHGGGPPCLTCIDREQAQAKYDQLTTMELKRIEEQA